MLIVRLLMASLMGLRFASPQPYQRRRSGDRLPAGDGDVTIDCMLAPWSRWSSCSRSCDGGMHERKRSIQHFASRDGKACTGALIEIAGCNLQLCPPGATPSTTVLRQDCTLSQWSDWSGCELSSTADGIRMQGQGARDRKITTLNLNGGRPCNDVALETDGCAYSLEPITTTYSLPMTTIPLHLQWDRTTTMIAPDDDEFDSDDEIAWRPRTTMHAPAPQPYTRDCVFVPWVAWSRCSATCGGGLKKRARSLLREASLDGKPCSGSMAEVAPCFIPPCRTSDGDGTGKVIDCEFSSWGDWSPLNSRQSVRQRRILTNPENGGLVCVGSVSETTSRSFATEGCSVSAWSPWGVCTQTCNGGQQHRFRRVVGRLPCAQPLLRDSQTCNTQPCLIDSGCDLTAWSEWFPCSATCGIGEQMRTRKIAGSRVCSWDPNSDISFTDSRECPLASCPLADDERFCSDRRAGGFSVGQPIVHHKIGHGLIACQSRYSAHLVGVCQAVAESTNGGDDYGSCATDHVTQFDFCAPRSLFFLSCAELESQTSALFQRTGVKGQRAEDTREFLRDVLIHHPQMMQNLTERVGEGLSWIFSTVDESSEVKTLASTTSPFSTTTAHFLRTSNNGHHGAIVETEEELFASRLPWLITWGASLCMMLCAGLALGVFCHAGFFRRGARAAPLLQDQHIPTATELQSNVATDQQE